MQAWRAQTQSPRSTRPPSSSPLTAGKGAHALLEVGQRHRTAGRIAANDASNRGRWQNRRRRDQPTRPIAVPEQSEHTLAESEDVRHAWPLGAEEDDHVLIDRE